MLRCDASFFVVLQWRHRAGGCLLRVIFRFENLKITCKTNSFHKFRVQLKEVGEPYDNCLSLWESPQGTLPVQDIHCALVLTWFTSEHSLGTLLKFSQTSRCRVSAECEQWPTDGTSGEAHIRMAPGGTTKAGNRDDEGEWNGAENQDDGANTSEDLPLRYGCDDQWCWNRRDKSHEVRLYGPRLRTAHFHPNWSNGTAGVRGTRALDSSSGRCYWEVRVSQRVFGTSMMFGVGTRRARLHVDAFVNLLGEDEHGWGLSHKGALWHDGHCTQYTKPFRENEATTVGLLYDGYHGTLTYYKDGQCLGVAFTGLNKISESLYPIICSTAAKTEMTLGRLRRDYRDLQDRCRAVILRHVHDGQRSLEALDLPNRLKAYVAEDLNATAPMSTLQPQQQHHNHHHHHGGDVGANWHRNSLIACYYV